MAKPANLPMPVDIVLSNPVVVSASGPAFRLILALSIVFWGGKCRPLPADDAGLCALARCGVSTWRRDGAAVREALRQIVPQLESQHARAVQRAEVYRRVKAEAGRKGAAVRWHKAKPAANAVPRLNDAPQNVRQWPSTVAPTRTRFSSPAQKEVQARATGMLRDE
jgi:hypothetical protein